jgi:hypothetical protein
MRARACHPSPPKWCGRAADHALVDAHDAILERRRHPENSGHIPGEEVQCQTGPGVVRERHRFIIGIEGSDRHDWSERLIMPDGRFWTHIH